MAMLTERYSKHRGRVIANALSRLTIANTERSVMNMNRG